MNIWAIVRMSSRALGRNKLRSALTMLGIIIGVGAVIAMVSLGQGAQSMVLGQISGMGSNMLTVMPGNMTAGGASLGAGASSTLTDDDVIAMQREIPTIAAASPSVSASGQMVFGNQNWFTRIQGTNEQFPRIRMWNVQQGEFFNEGHVRSSSRVIVLGSSVADKLTVRSNADAAQTFDQLSNIMTLLLGSIAGISLVVGGIGIMNIMLVPVTERTREIGIRMSVGARPNYVRMQFLTESVMLSLMGGAVGILIGGLLAAVVARVLAWPTLVSGLAVVVAFAFSTGIGVFFAFYPAHKAAALDPI